MGGKTTIQQPTPPPAPSPGQSAAEYAAALPSIYNTTLQYQPLFDQAQFDTYAQLAPEYARVARETMAAYSPTLASLDENLAQQALNMSQNGLSDSARNMYRDQFKSLVGNQVNSGLGADFIGKNLLEQDMNYRLQGQNLGLSLQGKVPITQAFQPASSFNVGQGFGNTFANQLGAYGSVYSGAGRPNFATSNPLGTFSNLLGGVGGLMTGIGTYRHGN